MSSNQYQPIVEQPPAYAAASQQQIGVEAPQLPQQQVYNPQQVYVQQPVYNQQEVYGTTQNVLYDAQGRQVVIQAQNPYDGGTRVVVVRRYSNAARGFSCLFLFLFIFFFIMSTTWYY